MDFSVHTVDINVINAPSVYLALIDDLLTLATLTT